MPMAQVRWVLNLGVKRWGAIHQLWMELDAAVARKRPAGQCVDSGRLPPSTDGNDHTDSRSGDAIKHGFIKVLILNIKNS